jgi:hypothetical protein
MISSIGTNELAPSERRRNARGIGSLDVSFQ